MAGSVWKASLQFTLVGPMVGLAIALGILAMNGALAIFFWRAAPSPPHCCLPWRPLSSWSRRLCHIVGAPAAVRGWGDNGLHVGLGRDHATDSLWPTFWSPGWISPADEIYGLDEFVVPHPHLGASPLLGPSIWLLPVAAIGSAAAVICVLLFRRR